jgi:hypothetical protein
LPPDRLRMNGILTGVDVSIEELLPTTEPIDDDSSDVISIKEDIEILA